MSQQQQLDANTAVNTVNTASRIFFLIPTLSHGDLFGLCKWTLQEQGTTCQNGKLNYKLYRSVLGTHPEGPQAS